MLLGQVNMASNDKNTNALERNKKTLLNVLISLLFILLFSENLNSQDEVYFCDFDNDVSGWITGATGLNDFPDNRTSWEINVPNQGMGYSNRPEASGWVGNKDPKNDHSFNYVNKVAGQGLSTRNKIEGVSSYYNNSSEWIMSPAISTLYYENLQLEFWRWANIEPNYDEAYVEISIDGINWEQLEHNLYPEDISWVQITIDIPQVYSFKQAIYLRWRTNSDNYGHYAGWNIDDVKVIGDLNVSCIWNGNISDNWNDPNNWDKNYIPSLINDIILTSSSQNNLKINNTYSCNSMLINPDAVLIIEEGGVLNVDTDVILSSSRTSNTGSILNYGMLNINGQSIFEIFIYQNTWTYTSVPIVGANSDSIDAVSYYWNEPAASDDFIRGWYLKNGEYTPMQGYDLKSTNGGNIQFVGNDFSNGDISLEVSHTVGDSVNGFEGWNLLGNPYPCIIDWDAISTVDRDIMGNALYIWNPVSETYSTYINGVGTNGGSRYIKPGQAFFIKRAEEGSSQITFTNDLKSLGSQSSILKSSYVSPNLRITSSGDYFSDEIIVRFLEVANPEYEKEFDAFKRFSNNKFVPQIYTLTEQLDELSINSLPTTNNYSYIPLHFEVGVAGNYALNFDGITMIGNSPIVLEDIVTGDFININENPVYKFSVSGAVSSNRFILHYNMPLSVTVDFNNVSCKGDDNGSIALNIIGGAWPYSIEWSNGLNSNNLDKLPAGLYEFVVTDASNNSVVQQISITEPMGIDIEVQKVYPSTPNSIDGSIILLVDNYSLSYNVEWSTGDISDYLFNVGEGNYSVDITDENGCVTSKDISLKIGEDDILGINNSSNDWVNIYSYSNNVIVSIFSTEIQKGIISIYDITGRLIAYNNFVGSGKKMIQIDQGPGIYIIKVSTIDKKIVNKVNIF